MIKKINNYLKNNNGDMYFQMLICLVAVVIIIAFSFNVITVMTQKVWLDDKLNDISRIIAVNGSYLVNKDDEEITEIQNLINEIEDRVGGEVTVTLPAGETWVNEAKGQIQLNDVFEVNYFNEHFPAITILNINIPIRVDLTRIGISEIYYKPSS